MKNTKELQAILTSIFVLNHVSEHKNQDIANICEYAFRRCLETNTNLLVLSTIGQKYPDMKEQVKELLAGETKYTKIMGGSL